MSGVTLDTRIDPCRSKDPVLRPPQPSVPMTTVWRSNRQTDKQTDTVIDLQGIGIGIGTHLHPHVPARELSPHSRRAPALTP